MLEKKIPDLAQRIEWNARWLPAYLGFGQMIVALIQGAPLRAVACSGDGTRWLEDGALEDRLPLCREILETGSAIVIPDLATFSHFQVQRCDDIRFFAGVPFSAGSVPVGTACLVDVAPHRLEALDFGLMEALARRGSAALSRRPYERPPFFSASSLVSRSGLEMLASLELQRAAEKDCTIHLLAFSGPLPNSVTTTKRTVIAELGPERFALLTTRDRSS